MLIQHKEMTAEEFLAYAEQHEDKRFDFIDGELVEVSPKATHSGIQSEFAIEFGIWLRKNPIGKVYTEALHVLGGKKYIPDVCIQTEKVEDYFNEMPPLVAVEIRSPGQSKTAQRKKAMGYIENGVKMSIIVFPGDWMEVYRPDREPLELTYGDTLNGDDVLPGFSVKVDGLL